MTVLVRVDYRPFTNYCYGYQINKYFGLGIGKVLSRFLFSIFEGRKYRGSLWRICFEFWKRKRLSLCPVVLYDTKKNSPLCPPPVSSTGWVVAVDQFDREKKPSPEFRLIDDQPKQPASSAPSCPITSAECARRSREAAARHSTQTSDGLSADVSATSGPC